MAKKPTRRPAPIPIDRIKEMLHDEWSRRVRERDGHVCRMCGRGKTYTDENGTEKSSRLSGHHWWRAAHRGGRTRYMVENGVTLCFACHNRGVHVSADHYTTEQLRKYVQSLYDYDVCEHLLPHLVPITNSECRQLALQLGMIEKVGGAFVRVPKKRRMAAARQKEERNVCKK